MSGTAGAVDWTEAPADTRVLLADMRLDNRGDLIGHLRSAGLLAEASPDDDALLLAAYRCWGNACPEHLLGDFALAVWDGPQQLLFCARDPMGVKPFHYTRIGPLVCFAPEAQQVLRHPAVPRRLDERTIADYLADVRDDPERTFFRGIHRLPAGHRLLLSAEGSRRERFWDVDPERRIVYRDDRDYSAHFLDLFQRAVGDRLRTPGGPAGILMSGGLDSTSVAAMARRSVPRGGSPALFSTSLVFPGLPACDERAFIETTAAALGLDTDLVDAERFWSLESAPLENPFISWEPAFREMLRRSRERGARVLLTGHGGDDLMAGSPLVYADRLRRGDLRVLAETVPHAWAQGRSGWRVLYNYFGRPLLPAVDRMARRIFRKPAGPQLPDWISPGFMARSGLAERLAERRPARPSRHGRGAAWQELYDDAVHVRGWERAAHWYTRNASPFGIEVRHPFLDRRLVEFMLAIPPRQRAQPGCYKPFLRRAMAGLLPEAVRQRRDKTSLSPFFDRAMQSRERATIERLLEAPLSAELGIVDAGKLRRAEASEKWFAITLEIWLRDIVRQLHLDRSGFGGAVC
jgi:asparagine synthase (glutamine-hydrolysing)